METVVESDEEFFKEDEIASDSDIWKDIMEKFDSERQQIDDYKKSKLTKCDRRNPTGKYLDEEIYVLLLDILEKTLIQAKETGSLRYHKSPFNPMDFISENLWNLNPKHPERQHNWLYIFDMDWVKDYLKEHPRPYFPFSWIWNKEYAALKIKAYMRGHWVRAREDVQEIRQFWKALLKEKVEAEQERKLQQKDACYCMDKTNEKKDESCYY